MCTNVNFRKDVKTGEIFAVLLDTQKNGKIECYSLYDLMHFDAKTDYLKECQNVTAKNGYNMNELCAYLISRGYKDISIKESLTIKQ